jgi:N-acetyl-gamma-glutamyl-phosphate reductase
LPAVKKTAKKARHSHEKTKVAVIGASGYVGEELVGLLLRHPCADVVAVTSRQFTGKTLSEIFPRFAHYQKACELRFGESDPSQLSQQAKTIFLALPHGLAAEFAKPLLQAGVRVLDLSADFRIRNGQTYKKFYNEDHRAPELLGDAVYGLPEIYRDKISEAKLVACPGCYPTSILLPLLPLVRESVVDLGSVGVTSLSGVTGAGRKVEANYLFAECNESLRPYGVPKHRHLSEIEEQLSTFAGEEVIIQFTPHLVPVNRGILTTTYLDLRKKIDSGSIASIYDKAYHREPFVRLLGDERFPDTKNVTGTNYIDVAWRVDERTCRVILMSAIDNIVKGASGQAIQCFNLMHGHPVTEGLL